MRKVIIAFIAGALFATVGSAYAEDIKSLVGMTKKIQAEVSVEVNDKTADRAGIVIDGTTYLPVRSIANVLDMNISYSKTEVKLTSKGVESVDTSDSDVPEERTMTPEDIQAIESSEKQIEAALLRIESSNNRIKVLTSEKQNEESKLASEKDEVGKQLLEMKIGTIESEIIAATNHIEMDKKTVSDLREYINKIKAKYYPPE